MRPNAFFLILDMLISTKKSTHVKSVGPVYVRRTYMLVRCHVGFTSVGPSTGFFTSELYDLSFSFKVRLVNEQWA